MNALHLGWRVVKIRQSQRNDQGPRRGWELLGAPRPSPFNGAFEESRPGAVALEGDWNFYEDET